MTEYGHSGEISDGQSPVCEFIVADNAVKATTETSEKKFQDSGFCVGCSDSEPEVTEDK